jgi:hypothetical protein
MKTIINAVAALAMITASVCAEDFTTINGKQYKDATMTLDQIDTALWLPMSEITVVETAGGYLLINTDDGEKAHASLLR